MGIEGITDAVASYQNTNTQAQSQQPVSSVDGVSENITQNPIAQEVLTVQDKETTDDNTPGEQKQDGKQPSKDTVKQTLSDINKKLNTTECVWGVDDATDRITIKIVDKETKDVIKELPPEKTLEMIAKAWELAGILVDEKL